MDTQTYEQAHAQHSPGSSGQQYQYPHTQPGPQVSMDQYQQHPQYYPTANDTPQSVNPSQQQMYFPPPPGPPPGPGYQQPIQPPPAQVPTADQYQQGPLPSAQQQPYFPPPPTSEHPQQSEPVFELETPPSKPPRPSHSPPRAETPQSPTYIPMGLSSPIPNYNYTPPPPPRRLANPVLADDDDPSSPVHYARDPHKLVAYLIPFPKPALKNVDMTNMPTRFLIYTPPPPPLAKPKEGDKEGRLHKVQRKWQEEVRSAKTSTAKTASWQGVKSKATKAIAWGVNQTTTSNLEFLGRVSDGNRSDSDKSDGGKEGVMTKKTVRVDEMLLVYPPSMGLNDQQMREEFVNTMLRTKSKAQRDSIIATGLLPVGYGIDILATVIWPFGGLGEIDTVWLYSSVRGAKTARTVTKRLSSSSESGDLSQDTLHLNFTASQRLDILQRYLEAECHRLDSAVFPGYHSPPTESQVLTAIGWSPAHTGGETKNWEDEQWEMTEVKDDLKSNMHKGAKEWKKFVMAYAKNPEKALKSNK